MRGTNTRADRAMAYLREHGAGFSRDIAEAVDTTANSIPYIMKPFVDDRSVIRERIPHPSGKGRPIFRFRLRGVVLAEPGVVKPRWEGIPAGPSYRSLLAREMLAANEGARQS